MNTYRIKVVPKQDESGDRLSDQVGEGEQLTYEYDFGDDGVHEIKIEKALTAEPGKHYPCALAASASAHRKTAVARPATNISRKFCVTQSMRNTTNSPNGPAKPSTSMPSTKPWGVCHEPRHHRTRDNP